MLQEIKICPHKLPHWVLLQPSNKKQIQKVKLFTSFQMITRCSLPCSWVSSLSSLPRLCFRSLSSSSRGRAGDQDGWDKICVWEVICKIRLTSQDADTLSRDLRNINPNCLTVCPSYLETLRKPRVANKSQYCLLLHMTLPG